MSIMLGTIEDQPAEFDSSALPRRIAIAMSGGGFRAAAFSLGTLSYLNALVDDGQSMLKNVKFIGSTSGGTITNIAYAVSVCNKEEFPAFYTNLLQFLEGDRLIKAVFHILKDDRYWQIRSEKSRNLINAFSIAYDELLFAHQEFGLFTAKLATTHLEEICINATEFSNGISLRFQTQAPLPNGRSNGKIGNAYIYFERGYLATADRLKLGDLLACSSCFSGGFEPFQFPQDFTHNSLSSVQLVDSIHYSTNPFTQPVNVKPLLQKKSSETNQKCFGIMDGGVADNQAIDSVLVANNRRKKLDEKFDLVLVTDVSSYFMDAYSLPVVKTGWLGCFSIRFWLIMLSITALSLPLSLIISLWTGWQGWMNFLAVPSTVTLYLLLKFLSGKPKRNDFDNRKSTWKIILKKYGGYFLDIPVGDVLQLLVSRLSSVFLLANDIYLKVIRRQYYQSIYKYMPISDVIVANAIYDLSRVRISIAHEQNGATRKAAGGIDPIDADATRLIPPPSPALMTVAEMAREMDTTLWFDNIHDKTFMKAAIVATGQFTTCYNLLKHAIEKNRLSEASRLQLNKDWIDFNLDPFALYNRSLQTASNTPQLEVVEIKGTYIICVKNE